MSTKTKLSETIEANEITMLNESMAKAPAGFETSHAPIKGGMENAPNGFVAQQASTKEIVAKAMKTSMEMMAFTQGNMEAFMKAGQIFTSELQVLSKHIISMTQTSVNETVAMTKEIAGVKSIKEALDLQSAFAQSMMQKATAETGRMTDESIKLTEKVMGPIAARITLAVEKFGETS